MLKTWVFSPLLDLLALNSKELSQ